MKAILRPILLLLLLPGLWPAALLAEDGHELWLRYAPLDTSTAEQLHSLVSSYALAAEDTPTTRLAVQELERGVLGLLSTHIVAAASIQNASIVLATPTGLPTSSTLSLPFADLGPEGFLLRTVELEGQRRIVVAANTDIGLLYGVFELLRQFQINTQPTQVDVVSVPRIQRRMLNHWDNLDGSVERGYAGNSLWDWWRLPQYLDPRYTAYARANASIGINGTVLNNVNSNAQILTAPYLEKVAAIAGVLRPWGIKVYLSARFSAPQEIGGLPTSDPLDAAVQQWWRNKADEIYTLIPDFGGFLVKANSEGQPGPGDFGRSHAEGANVLAAAVAPHDGVVLWRAFVYSDTNPEDRAKQAYTEFKALDGQFDDNVIVQVKNGPIDFQPREPFHPMFGAMPQTPLMLELQITKEYLGFATHLVYLGPQYEEVLRSDTHAKGAGSLVADVIDGSLHGYQHTAIAGVANIGTDRDWSGSDFNQANWYVFGRMAWNPALAAEPVAREWLNQTFARDAEFVAKASHLMLRSHEAAVDYMTPLGLAHLMGTGHHYGPAPWVSSLARPEWNPAYYHRADRSGIGFDRTAAGSKALAQYAPEVAARYADPATMDERMLLWFHHVPWQQRLQSGQTLWESLVMHYDRGVAEVAQMQQDWAALEPYVDKERFNKAADFLQIQFDEAQWWRDACLSYFMSVAQLPLPAGVRAPAHKLEYYQALEFPAAPG